MSEPWVSVVIPTCNRARLLDGVLASLGRQAAAPPFEVVVVDDGSTDDTAAVVARHLAAGLPVRRVHQPNAGLNAARNRGAADARGAILCYLDDDALAGPGWVRAVADTFAAHPDAAAAGGPVRLRFEAPPPEWLRPRLHQFLSALDGPPEPGWLRPPALPVGANFALARPWWEKLGGFRAGLDRRRSSLLSNGEVELFRRLLGAGGRIAWSPAAWVLHRVPPERLTKDWFRRRAFDQGVSDGLLDTPACWREVVRAARAGAILARGRAGAAARLHADLWLRYCYGRLRAAKGGQA